MTQRPDPDPTDDALLIDAIQGELDASQAAELRRRQAQQPELDRALAGWVALGRLEREAFEPAADLGRTEGVRLAAWIRSTVQREEAARGARARTSRGPARSWTRILAWSVAAHVVVLGVLAFLLRSETPSTSGTGPSIGLADNSFDTDDLGDEVEFGRNIAYYESLVHRDLGARFDELAMIEQEDLGELGEELEGLLREEPAAWGERAHPVGVVVPMTRRRVDGLKRRRLRLLGFNESGTLAAVDKGLGFLAPRQDVHDGSFPAADGRDASQQTALVLMAFLGEGHTSQGRRERDQVVDRGVGFLRRQAFGDSSGAQAPVVGTSERQAPRLKPLTASALAPLTIALSEDYMLSYGALTLSEADRRAAEIGVLAGQVRTVLDPAHTTARLDAGTRTWLLWALDATQRTGIVAPTPGERAAFRSWVAAATTGEELAASATVEDAIIAGTALLYVERGAEKPRFMSWSRDHLEQLVDRLDPRGGARSGDPVGDTARILLALQVAYRTY